MRYVVTEFGVADLWGKNIRERSKALIEIAHPKFREELLAAAKARRYVVADQVIPSAAYPWTEDRRIKLTEGAELLLRTIRLTDEGTIQRLLYGLSDESVYRRFLGFKKAHPHEEMQNLVDIDYESNMGIVACLPATDELIAMARYDVSPATRLADIAFVVKDEWQQRGVGTALFQRMIEIARARGLAGFEADVLASNKPMLVVFHRSGLHFESQLESGVYHLTARF